MPRPMPREPPVTTATRPARLRVSRRSPIERLSTGAASYTGTDRVSKPSMTTRPKTRVANVVQAFRRATVATTWQTSRSAFDVRRVSTTLNSAPPLAKLLTSTIGPGASTASRASRSVAVAGSGVVQAGDRRHAARRGRRATPRRTRRCPTAPNSPSAPLIDVTTARPPPKSSSAPAPRPRRGRASRSPTRRPRRPRPARGRRPRAPGASCAPAARADRATR